MRGQSVRSSRAHLGRQSSCICTAARHRPLRCCQMRGYSDRSSRGSSCGAPSEMVTCYDEAWM